MSEESYIILESIDKEIQSLKALFKEYLIDIVHDKGDVMRDNHFNEIANVMHELVKAEMYIYKTREAKTISLNYKDPTKEVQG